VINVGCAEGYYAIGFARCLPQATVYAFDIDRHAQAICASAAKDNGIADRINVEGICTADRLAEIIENSTSTLIVMDCEGAEIDLLDPLKVPGLARCDIVVEAHDFIVPEATKILEDRFRASHAIDRITQGGRNPNEIEELADYSEADRWLMVDEKRPAMMTWLACWARSA
jgi:predicted O-methyltransferase YrrM